MIKGIMIDVVENGEEYARGKIVLGDFDEYFEMSLDWWGIRDYTQQWQDGLKRLNEHSKSCFVASLNDPHQRPYINWWLLYKDNEMIYVQNQIIIGELYHELIGNQWFTSKTCYDFIPERYTEEEVSEWIITQQ